MSSTVLGHVVPLLQALSGRLKFTVRRHKVNEDSLFPEQVNQDRAEDHLGGSSMPEEPGGADLSRRDFGHAHTKMHSGMHMGYLPLYPRLIWKRIWFETPFCLTKSPQQT